MCKAMQTCVVFMLLCGGAFAGDDLRVLPEQLEGGIAPREMMREFLLGRLAEQWEKLKAGYEERTTPEAIAEHQQKMRRIFLDALGPFPERTPLNPQITGVVEREGYRVEKVLFESRPKFYVSAALFLPDPARHQPPHPGVIVPCGHAENAKAHDTYQSMGALLALNGMAALVFDPVDQGERMQLLDESGKHRAWGTRAHNLLGAACILLGQNTASFEVWDGMCAIDYLQSRPEVDPERIGCTGNSGGGTQTSYLMALDCRIKAAAPSCYLHHQSVQLRKAVGDAEQNLFGQMLEGPDHPDFISMRAPSPVLICAATRDFFDINATWETFRLAKRLYTRMGFPERMDLLENDEKHNFNKIPREGVARWMSRWLLGKDQAIVEPELKLIPEEELWCTPRGQVMLLEGARSAYDINADMERELAEQRRALWASRETAQMLGEVRWLAGIRSLEKLPKAEVKSAGEAMIDGRMVEKLVFTPEPGVLLPALLFTPANAKPGEAALVVSEKGKEDAARPGGPVDALLKEGITVLAVDLRGTGETEPGMQTKEYEGSGGEWEDYFRAYALGRSYAGMRAEDILVCAKYLKDKCLSVRLEAYGNTGVPALHAAVMEPHFFTSVKVSGMVTSWSDAVRAKPAMNQLVNAVHGALKMYDLPDLAGVLGEKLTIGNSANAGE